MMIGQVTAVGASGVTVKLLGRSGAGIEVPIAAGNVATRVVVLDYDGGVPNENLEPAIAVGDRVAVAELTAEPGSWLLLTRLG